LIVPAGGERDARRLLLSPGAACEGQLESATGKLISIGREIACTYFEASLGGGDAYCNYPR
jgi:hypothetical protein